MPILVRPVREQLEHDRIIRLLEAKWRRKFKVDANPGDERNAGVKVPSGTLYPDLILTEEGGRKPKALVEVETNESVNHLEAMAQWANLAKSRTSLFLFVPVGAAEAARRLATESSVKLAELWTYLVLGDQVRFTSVFREDGAEPADLIEKVEVFTTERAAPAPRPVATEGGDDGSAADQDRPRKLAVKIGSRAIDGVAKIAAAAGRVAARMADTMMTKSAVKSTPLQPRTTLAAPRAAAAKAPAPKPAAVQPVATPAVPPKAAGPIKAPVSRPAEPKPAEPKVAAPKVAEPRPAEKTEKKPLAKAIEKPPAKAIEKVPARPTEKVALKAAEKPVVKKAAARPEVKKAVAKAAPAKAAVVTKKPAAKAASRPVARKAAPVRPAGRAVIAKKAAPAAKAGPSKRK